MTNDVEIFFEDVPQQQNVLNVSTSVNESGDSELIVGLSAYQIAVNRGFVGTVEEWLLSLKGDDGLSAYDVAVLNGFAGDESQWIESLRGVNGNEGISGIDGESAYQVASRNGFVGSEVEWLDSLKATTDVVDTTPQRKNLVPDGALETSNGQYQVFTSDNTNQLLPLLGAGGLTAEMSQVDWLDPKTNEFTVRVKIPAGLDVVDLDAPTSPLVYVIFASTNLLDILSGNGIGAIVAMGYNKNAGVLQLMVEGTTSSLTEIPYVIDQEIEIKYNKIYNTVTLKTLDNDTTVLAGYITTPEHDLMNVGVMYANFSQPTPIVSLSAYVETTPIVVTVEDSLNKISTRINAVESSIESLEQTNSSLDSRVYYLDDTQISMQQQLNSISNVNNTVNQLSDTVNQLAQNSVTQQSKLSTLSQRLPSTVTSDDSIVSAIEKLQAQVNSLGGGSGSSSVERKYPVNFWVNQLNAIVSGAAGSYTTAAVFMTYFSLPHTIKITRVHIPFTGALANRTARLRLYRLNGNIATAVTETYDIPASTLDAVFDFVSELTILSGEYFWAVQNTGTAAASNTIRAITSAVTLPIPRTSIVNNTSFNLLSITLPYANPLPDTVDVSVSALSLANVPAINMFVTG